ncbi:hypothetical protein [Rubrivirga sp.]|uniref:hypothetical protein n=1 Tax=Rubrivirga sp. TaxID=1885344 RepID=UPI003B51B2DD
MRALLLAAVLLAPAAAAQTIVPPEFLSRETAIARGILDGNLIETNFRNHGEWARFGDTPHGVWPRGIGGRHIDGIGVVIAGQVEGRMEDGSPTTLTPVVLNYRSGVVRGPDDLIWGFLPIEGFNNPLRIDPVTGRRRPTPALSNDPTSWPAFWPDRLDNPDDPGWRYDDVDNDPSTAGWNGIFGKGVFNADLEAYYVMNDRTDYTYRIDPTTGRLNSEFGVFYNDPSDESLGGLGLQVAIRSLQWANVLSEDAMFILYTVSNVGGYNHDRLYFSQIIDYGLPPEGNEIAAFDPQIDVAFGYDEAGLCTRPTGGTYDCGYTGIAFLESPAEPVDGLDNDEDGITDESRFSGPGTLITGQDNIRAYVEANYDVANFIAFNAEPGQTTLEDVLARRPAYEQGRWWTGDENLDWVTFTDLDENGQFDDGEPLGSDFGLDGLGPFDVGYPGPDTGEADGVPDRGEPDFDRTDVDESDQIGLTGFDLDSRSYYEGILRFDELIFSEILDAQFPLGTRPSRQQGDLEPFLLFASGPTGLVPFDQDPSLSTDFFSTAWLFGSDERDFFKNRVTVQSIYNADYQFAQPPIAPRLTAQAGDGRVTLTWDNLSLQSFDRFCQAFDFEGYKLYRGTDPLLSDARTISDAFGTPTFYEPIAQWDIQNGITGTTDALGGDLRFNLGTDSGLQFFYVDDDVRNGFTYYYALVAYDRGCGRFEIGDDGVGRPAEGDDSESVEPQINTFNISVDALFNLRGLSRNAAVVTPRADAAGFVSAGVNEDLSRPTGRTSPNDGTSPLAGAPDGQPVGTGSVSVTVYDEALAAGDRVFRVEFFGAEEAGDDEYQTAEYRVVDVASGEVLLPRTPFNPSSPGLAGLFLTFDNDDSFDVDRERLGWVGDGPDGLIYSRDPTTLPSYMTDWQITVEEPVGEEDYGFSVYDYEVMWTDPNGPLYLPPRYRIDRFLRTEIPIFAVNTTLGTEADLVIRDLDDDGAFGPADALLILERNADNDRTIRHRITFESDGGPSPRDGARLQINRLRPFATGDFFQFTVRGSFTDTETATSELDAIRVVPNPYVGAAAWEQASPQAGGRGEREVQFRHLPETATIRIFNIRGELIRRLDHQGFGGDGQLSWDLKTSENLDIASGMYIYHVEAPGVGEYIGKLAIIK